MSKENKTKEEVLFPYHTHGDFVFQGIQELQGDTTLIYTHDSALKAMGEWSAIKAVGFGEFLQEATGQEKHIYIDRNPFGIKPGYYTHSQLYNIFIQQTESNE